MLANRNVRELKRKKLNNKKKHNCEITNCHQLTQPNNSQHLPTLSQQLFVFVFFFFTKNCCPCGMTAQNTLSFIRKHQRQIAETTRQMPHRNPKPQRPEYGGSIDGDWAISRTLQLARYSDDSERKYRHLMLSR